MAIFSTWVILSNAVVMEALTLAKSSPNGPNIGKHLCINIFYKHLHKHNNCKYKSSLIKSNQILTTYCFVFPRILNSITSRSQSPSLQQTTVGSQPKESSFKLPLVQPPFSTFSTSSWKFIRISYLISEHCPISICYGFKHLGKN